MHIETVISNVGVIATALAANYASVVLIAGLLWRRRRTAVSASRVLPVTLLKPLCGDEPHLYDHLRSFCLQDHPDFQIVFGVREPCDPALAVAYRLVAEFPDLPIYVVINPQLHGSNYMILV